MKKIFITGNLTKDPELKEVGENKVCNFSIANNDFKKTDNAEFYNCVAWNKNAENIDNYFSKGDKIFIEGNFRQNEYENADGEKRSSLEIVVSSFEFFQSRKNEDTET